MHVPSTTWLQCGTLINDMNEARVKRYRIALYPGDGIGREVTEEVVRLLQHLQGPAAGFEMDSSSSTGGATTMTGTEW